MNNGESIQQETIDYDQHAVDEHIDMNPPQIVEPLTGSSVLVEPQVLNKMSNNGFPIGYGPNAGMKKIEKLKKPKFSERLKHVRNKMSKRTKISLIVGSVSLFLVIGGFAIYAMITGMFKIDYSATYITAKELRGTMQKLRSDASCEKVIEYLNSQYTNMELYNGYVEKCRKIGEGVTLDMITAVGDTAGVLRDEEVRKRYETFYRVIVAARDGNAKVDKLLDTYVLWHSWIVKENSGNSIHNDWDWSEADIDNATKILTDSKIDEFQKYGTEWAKYKKEAAKATHTFMHSAMISDLNEAKNEMEAKQKAFNEWKIKNLPVVTELYPLELADTAKIYTKFEEMYNFIRETYQNNYNRRVGGCKELINSVICD